MQYCYGIISSLTNILFQTDTGFSKEFRKAARTFVFKIHQQHVLSNEEFNTTAPQNLSLEINNFIRRITDEWHDELAGKKPCLVSKTMSKIIPELPKGINKSHYDWLMRYLARWHRRNAGKCDVMSGWSSGGNVTEDDENYKIDDDQKVNFVIR